MFKKFIQISLICLMAYSASAFAKLPFAVGDKELPSLAPMLENVQDAIVNISTVTNVRVRQYNPFFDDPFFRRFYGMPNTRNPQKERIKKRQGLGSGVILDAKKGLIVTNTHVIDGVDEIAVTLKDGREFDAKLVGLDKETDVAIIQVKAKNLKEIVLADSDKLRVGDFVVAIGNPYGLRQTVTSGIVSGLERSGLGIESYENFIQTDASINPGNSGGALVNLRGELVGINTAIYSPAGGSVGINFAIPINMVMKLKPQLVKYGEVKRGLLGIEIQDLTPSLAQALNLDITKGALVSVVQQGSSAQKSGLRSGDVIVSCNKKLIADGNDFRNVYGLSRIGDKLDMQVVRDNKKINIVVKLDDELGAKGGKALHPRLEGATLKEVASGKGVEVSKVESGSSAQAAGLRQGDLIKAANRTPVKNLASLHEALSKQTGLMLNIQRGSSSLLILLH